MPPHYCQPAGVLTGSMWCWEGAGLGSAGPGVLPLCPRQCWYSSRPPALGLAGAERGPLLPCRLWGQRKARQPPPPVHCSDLRVDGQKQRHPSGGVSVSSEMVFELEGVELGADGKARVEAVLSPGWWVGWELVLAQAINTELGFS